MAKVQFTKRQETSQIFVHCSATKATMDVGVREIRQWHKEQGWLDVGYHFIIRRDGTVGRAVTKTLWVHTSRGTTRLLSVCVWLGASTLRVTLKQTSRQPRCSLCAHCW